MNSKALMGCAAVVLVTAFAATGAESDNDLASRVRILEENLAGLTDQVGTLSGNTTQLIKAAQDNATKLAENYDRVNELTDKINAQLEEQRQLLGAVAGWDSNHKPFVRLNSIMNGSDEARSEVRRAVERSIRRWGTLTLVNRMGSAQDIVVNGSQHRVLAGASLEVRVPVGTVSLRLPGQNIVNWSVSPPSYRQTVEITPRTTVTAMSPVIVDTPYYVDPWSLSAYSYIYP